MPLDDIVYKEDYNKLVSEQFMLENHARILHVFVQLTMKVCFQEKFNITKILSVDVETTRHAYNHIRDLNLPCLMLDTQKCIFTKAYKRLCRYVSLNALGFFPTHILKLLAWNQTYMSIYDLNHSFIA